VTPGQTPGPHPESPADRSQSDEAPQERDLPSLLEQMGGVQGLVASTIPVAVFVVANIAFGLQPAVIAALVAGVVVAVWRIARKQPLQPAVSGLFGVGVAAFIAYRTGEARGFYLPGLLVSAGQSWRSDPRLLRAYTFATGLWTLVFASRVVVQGWLYSADEETWLGIARLAMGYPLVGLALLGTVWAVRRARSDPAPA
jgi:hypothetical protein